MAKKQAVIEAHESQEIEAAKTYESLSEQDVLLGSSEDADLDEELGVSEDADPMGAFLKTTKVDDGSFLKPSQRRTIAVDLTGVDEGSFNFPTGIYCAKLANAEYQESEGKNPAWVFSFLITKGPERNRSVKLWRSLTGGDAQKTKSCLSMLGAVLKALGHDAFGKSAHVEVDALVGTACKIQVVNEEYQGETRTKIKKVIEADEEAWKAAQDARNQI